MDEVDRKILCRIQADFPLVPRPFAALAQELGLSEEEVLSRTEAFHRSGLVRRIGPVINPDKVGRVGSLVAMSVPEERIEEVAARVSAFRCVSHNYQREARHGQCPYNLWFTVSAASEERLAETIAEIEKAAGLASTTLPSGRKFKIGVRFDLGGDETNG